MVLEDLQIHPSSSLKLHFDQLNCKYHLTITIKNISDKSKRIYIKEDKLKHFTLLYAKKGILLPQHEETIRIEIIPQEFISYSSTFEIYTNTNTFTISLNAEPFINNNEDNHSFKENNNNKTIINSKFQNYIIKSRIWNYNDEKENRNQSSMSSTNNKSINLLMSNNGSNNNNKLTINLEQRNQLTMLALNQYKQSLQQQ
ncbi:hypothetical protein ABK040_009036 [Willaertia magna]